MKYLAIVSAGILLSATQDVAWAQIYETRDEQGNPVFSDAPVDGSSTVIDLTETNVADGPPPTPEAETTPAATTDNPDLPETADRPTYQDPNAETWDERVRRQEKFDRVKSSSTPHTVLDTEPRRVVKDAEPRRVVRDAEPRRTVRDAAPRREVMDAEPRREVGDF